MRMHLVVALVLVLLIPSAVEVGASWVQQGAGSRIAFTRLREDVNRPGGDFRFEAEVWMMNGDGSEPTRLTYNATDDLARPGRRMDERSRSTGRRLARMPRAGSSQLARRMCTLIDLETRASGC